MNYETGFQIGVIQARLKKVKQDRDKYKKERDTLVNDITVLRKQYKALTDYIRFKAETNPSAVRYIDLVNYINRLERADDER